MVYLFGFIVTIILAIISSIPIWVMLKLKNNYNNVIAWILFFICGFIYILLKITCVDFGILKDSNGLPFVALFIIYSISRIGITENTDNGKEI